MMDPDGLLLFLFGVGLWALGGLARVPGRGIALATGRDRMVGLRSPAEPIRLSTPTESP